MQEIEISIKNDSHFCNFRQSKSRLISLADLHTKFSDARPPTGPNSFIFTKKCLHWRSTPPKTGPPPREILDPPLHIIDV